ncbi:MAG TPA: molybdopterin-dependent oxidoreductase, partial [Symbiobacteriaceae bacterium]|nr:molybdopterin-dependent oxidoreductase [Symbiobacteriaceae bacterium]
MRDELSDIKVFRATCPRNCYDSCAMLVTVAGGIVRQVDGDPANPHTAGRLCSKGYSYVQRTYATNRIRHPMVQTVRGSGNWRRITWDEALDRIARKLIDVRRRHGSLLPVCLYKGTGNVGVLHNAPEAMFAAMGPHTETVFVMCWQAGNDAQRFDFGDNMTSDPGEMLKARTLLLWGVNPAWTAVHQMARIMQARDSGTRVITIDPIRTATASRSDRHLGLRPGSDGALALGMARCLLDEELYDEAFLNEHVTGWTEFRTYLRDQITVDWAARETGLPAAAIRETAVAYATARPAMIWVGFGMQRHTNALQTVRAIDALAAMTGQIGLPGTGVQYGQLANWIFGDHLRSYKGGAGQPYSGPGAIDGNRTFPNGCIGEAMPAVSDPPLEVLWVACANPVAQEPDSHAVRRALSGLDMVVVVDQFMTATAEAADIVLPATTFLEHADLHTSYWHHHVSITERAIAPLYEAKSDLAIAWALSRKLNQLSPGFTTFPATRIIRFWITIASPMVEISGA